MDDQKSPDMVKITDVMREMYEQFDVVVETARKNVEVSCKEGCAHCCYLLTSILVPEAELIAEHLIETGKWREMLPKLREGAIASDFPGINKTNFFKKQSACPFLENQRCSIYAQRPACCRLHLVASPPDDCAGIPENEQKRTVNLDMRELEAVVWEFAKNVEEAHKIDSPLGLVFSPIPVMVIDALRRCSSDMPDIRKELDEVCGDVTSPSSWVLRHMESIAREDSGMDKAAREELYSIGKKIFE